MSKIYNPRSADNPSYSLTLHQTASGLIRLDIVDTNGVTRYTIAQINKDGTLSLFRYMKDKAITDAVGIITNEEGSIAVRGEFSLDDIKQHKPYILKPYSPDDKEGYSIGLQRDCEDIDIVIIDNSTGQAEEVIACITEESGLHVFDMSERNSIYSFPLTAEGFIKEIAE